VGAVTAYRIELQAVVQAKSEHKALKLLDRLQALVEPSLERVDNPFSASLKRVAGASRDGTTEDQALD
jgi:hypothetical protein